MNDDATSLYTGMPLNRNHAQSMTSIPPQHGENPFQTGRPGRRSTTGLLRFAVTSQSRRPQHNPRNSSWDLLGGARKFVQAYEQFDPRNASEQHLVFADGELPNSKVSYLYFFDAHSSEIQALLLSQVISLLASTNFF